MTYLIHNILFMIDMLAKKRNYLHKIKVQHDNACSTQMDYHTHYITIEGNKSLLIEDMERDVG